MSPIIGDEIVPVGISAEMSLLILRGYIEFFHGALEEVVFWWAPIRFVRYRLEETLEFWKRALRDGGFGDQGRLVLTVKICDECAGVSKHSLNITVQFVSDFH